MATKPNMMITLVISAAVSALILANSAPARAGSHGRMMGRSSHVSSQQGMSSNSASPIKSSMYDLKTNTGNSSSGTKNTMYNVKMNEVPSPWKSGKMKGTKSLTTRGNEVGGTQQQVGKGSTVTNSQLTPFTSQAMESIQKQALFGNQAFPFTHPKGTTATGAGSNSGTSIGGTKFNPKDAVFGNQPYTHRGETTGTGAGSETGTGAATNSGSGRTGSDVTTANAGNSQAQSTVVTPPNQVPVIGNRKPLNPAVGSVEADSDTTGGSRAARAFVKDPKGEGPENWGALLNDCPSGLDSATQRAYVQATPDHPGYWQCITLGENPDDWTYNGPDPTNWPDNFVIYPQCDKCPTIVYKDGIVFKYFPNGMTVTCTYNFKDPWNPAWPSDGWACEFSS